MQDESGSTISIKEMFNFLYHTKHHIGSIFFHRGLYGTRQEKFVWKGEKNVENKWLWLNN